MISQNATPYHNLILTGYMGVGKLNVGRLIAKQVSVPFVDLEAEIHLRHGNTADEIRQLFGIAKLQTIEEELCREMSLRRGSVLSISGTTLLDQSNRERLTNSGPILVLTCALNEILHRLYASQGARFHDPKVRAAALNNVRREQQITQIHNLHTLDTTRLTIEEVAEKALAFWYEQETVAL